MDNWREASSVCNTAYKRLWLVGGGALAREAIHYIDDIQQSQGACLPLMGFLDNFLCHKAEEELAKLGERGRTLCILPLDDYMPQEVDVFINALVNPATKRLLIPPLIAKGARFLTAIHPSARIGVNTRIGVGSTVGYVATITTNVQIGEFVGIFDKATVGHDANIGDYSTLMTGCHIGGAAQLGQGVEVNPHACVMAYAHMQDYAALGVQSVLMRGALARTMYFGNPAIAIGPIRPKY